MKDPIRLDGLARMILRVFLKRDGDSTEHRVPQISQISNRPIVPPGMQAHSSEELWVGQSPLQKGHLAPYAFVQSRLTGTLYC